MTPKFKTTPGWPWRGVMVTLKIPVLHSVLRMVKWHHGSRRDPFIAQGRLATIPTPSGGWCKTPLNPWTWRKPQLTLPTTHVFPFCLCPLTERLRFSGWRNSLQRSVDTPKHLRPYQFWSKDFAIEEVKGQMSSLEHKVTRQAGQEEWRGWPRAWARGDSVCGLHCRAQGGPLPAPRHSGHGSDNRKVSLQLSNATAWARPREAEREQGVLLCIWIRHKAEGQPISAFNSSTRISAGVNSPLSLPWLLVAQTMPRCEFVGLMAELDLMAIACDSCSPRQLEVAAKGCICPHTGFLWSTQCWPRIWVSCQT